MAAILPVRTCFNNHAGPWTPVSGPQKRLGSREALPTFIFKKKNRKERGKITSMEVRSLGTGSNQSRGFRVGEASGQPWGLRVYINNEEIVSEEIKLEIP